MAGPTPTGQNGPNGAAPTWSASAIKDAKAALRLLEKQAEAQSRINDNATEYFKLLKDIGNIQKNIKHLEKQRLEFEKKRNAAATSGNIAEYHSANETVKLLEEKLKLLKETSDAYVEVAKQADKSAMGVKFLISSAKKIPSIISGTYGMIKSYGLFDMDKAMKSAALEMGVLSKQSASFRNTITSSAMGMGKVGDSTIELGIGIEDLAKIQAEYSNELGRTVTFTDSGNQSMAQLAKGTSLGADGAARFAAEMETFGLSVSATRDYVEQTMNDAHKMGLNASKVIKNIQGNLKLLNKYSFKGGTKGLASMAESATKMNIDMNSVSGMADKLFDIDGAVEMSAQLQVLGGEWSKLADPFKLMYMARNDMDGLMKSVVNATKGTAKFNKESKNFEIPALELHRLRKVAEATGIAYDDLAVAAKNAAKYSVIDGSITMNVDKDTKEYLENMSTFNDEGKAEISITDGDKVYSKLVSALNETDLERLKSVAAERQSLKERAKDSQTFDESLKNTLTLFKSAMLPVVKEINESLKPFLTEIFANTKFKQQLIDFGKDVGKVIGAASDAIKWVAKIGEWIGPKGILATIIGGEILFNVGKWYANGIALAAGFNASASGRGVMGGLTGGLSKMGKGSVGKGLAVAGGLGIGGTVLGGVIDATTDPGSAMNILGNAAADAMTGAALGSFLGPIGAGIGAAIGGLYGGIKAYNSRSEGANDAIFNSPVNDGFFSGSLNKFSNNTAGLIERRSTGINDGVISNIGSGLGSDFNKGRGIIQGGKITPIDNKDDLIAAKPNGVIDRSTKNSNNTKEIKISFSDIKFDGQITLSGPGNGNSIDITRDLLKNQDFVRNITKMIHIESSKAINGGKISSSPSV